MTDPWTPTRLQSLAVRQVIYHYALSVRLSKGELVLVSPRCSLEGDRPSQTTQPALLYSLRYRFTSMILEWSYTLRLSTQTQIPIHGLQVPYTSKLSMKMGIIQGL